MGIDFSLDDDNLHVMSKEIGKELKVIPVQVEVVEHGCYVYFCRNFKKENVKTPVIIVKAPAPVLLGNFVSLNLWKILLTFRLTETVKSGIKS